MIWGKVPGAGRRLRRLCKWDDLSSDAQHTSKKSGMSMHACNPSRGKQVPGTHWPASLNCWIPDALRPRLKGKPQKLWWWWRRWEVWLRKMPKLASAHTHWCTFIHAHANTSMHTWTSTSPCIPMKTLFPLLSSEEDCPIHLEHFSSHPLPSCKYPTFWYNLKRITFIFCSSLWLIAVATAKSTNLYP